MKPNQYIGIDLGTKTTRPTIVTGHKRKGHIIIEKDRDIVSIAIDKAGI